MAKEAQLMALAILCPDADEESIITEYEFSAQCDECELCGSHGKIELYVNNCTQCGKSHDIEISSW